MAGLDTGMESHGVLYTSLECLSKWRR